MKLFLILMLIVSSSFALGKTLKLKTTSFDPKQPLPNKFVFNGFGCSGENISPELEWSGVPKGTKSFAITVFDPDAPTGSGWWHWTVVNIPANVTKIEEGASSKKTISDKSTEGRTDFGRPGYGGACPPKGDQPHRYIFTVYALKTDRLDINGESSGAMVGFNLPGNTIEKASFTVKYAR